MNKPKLTKTEKVLGRTYDAFIKAVLSVYPDMPIDGVTDIADKYLAPKTDLELALYDEVRRQERMTVAAHTIAHNGVEQFLRRDLRAGKQFRKMTLADLHEAIELSELLGKGNQE